MEAGWNFWTILFLVIAGQGILLAGLILKMKPYYRYFSWAIVLFSALLFYYVTFWTGNIQSLPRGSGIIMGFPYLIAPLIYRQIKRFTLWRHMLVFLLYTTFILLSALVDFPPLSFQLQAAFQCIFVLVYASLAIRHSSSFITNKIAWLFLGFGLAHLSYYILYWTNILTRQQDYFVSLMGSVFMYGGAYLILFSKKKSEPTDDLQMKMRNILIERIEEEKLYLDNELRLQSLSEATGFSIHQISELINSGGKNFADLINGYRVQEAKKLLQSLETSHLSTTEIGYAAGFNNKSSFFKHFKKVTGESPMQFRNRSKIASTAGN